jgi:hypothetical protein
MFIRLLAIASALSILAGCSRDPNRLVVIGEGYVGPMTLSIREELAAKAPTVATVKHGQRLEILQRRRRFVRVRTPGGAEGWLDGSQLMTSEQMEELRQRATQYANAPSMGRATVHDSLNIHTEPNRQAPSFHRIPEQGSVEVLAQKVAPRVPFDPPAPPTPPKPVPVRKRKPKEEKVPALPPPQAPEPPENWLELSKTEFPEPEKTEETNPKVVEKPRVRLDEWSLVRTTDGKVGWVVTRALVMAIPDEVAQYAEGHRITSYFSLGTVQDEGKVKHSWLWTTISKSFEPYQFDGLRVFTYNTRRHRYETAYIERNLKGYYPVQAFPKGLNGSGSPAFTAIVEEGDGQVYKRTYEFQGYRYRLTGREPWKLAPEQAAKPDVVNVASAPPPEKSVFGKIKEKILGR